MSRRRTPHQETPIEVRLPITPMLDMTFQLLFYFVIMFRPTPVEGQIALYLPKEKGADRSSVAPLDPSDLEKPEEYALEVRSARGETESVNVRPPSGTPYAIDVVADKDRLVRTLYEELEKVVATRYKGRKPPNMKIEFDDDLKYSELIRIMDVCLKAGFASVGPTPLQGR
jgi:biopolymer transport protein ExbD